MPLEVTMGTFDDDLDRDDPHDAIDVLADTSEVERAARRARPNRVPASA